MIKKESKKHYNIGNNYNAKYKTAEDRQGVYKRFCDHVAKGLSLDCFPECSENTMRSMIDKYSDELSPDLLETAKREAKCMLERMGMGGASGQIKRFNCKAWQFIMMNKFGMSLKITNDNFSHQKEEYKKELIGKSVKTKKKIAQDKI